MWVLNLLNLRQNICNEQSWNHAENAPWEWEMFWANEQRPILTILNTYTIIIGTVLYQAVPIVPSWWTIDCSDQLARSNLRFTHILLFLLVDRLSTFSRKGCLYTKFELSFFSLEVLFGCWTWANLPFYCLDYFEILIKYGVLWKIERENLFLYIVMHFNAWTL